MNCETGENGSAELAQCVFEGIGMSGAISAGRFLSLGGTRILVEGGWEGFGLHGPIWQRWFFCSEIIRSLRRYGFTNEQITFIARDDEELLDMP